MALLLSGYIGFQFIRHQATVVSSYTVYLGSLVVGTSMFVVPFCVVGTIFGGLSYFVIIYTFLVFLLAGFLLVRNLTKTMSSIKNSVRNTASSLLSRSAIGKIAAVSFAAYIVKVSFCCLLGPIISGDALYFWLSMAKVFVNTDSIPVVDPYHLWRYTGEPCSSSLFSWGMFLAGSADVEAFRGISVLFLAALPMLAHTLVKSCGGTKDAADAAMIIMCFMPVTDYMMYVYSFYADSISVVLAVTSILFFRVAVREKSIPCSLVGGFALSMALLSKYGFGLIAGLAIVVDLTWSLGNLIGWKLVAKICTTLLILAMLLIGNSMWSLLTPITSIILAPIVLGILAARYKDSTVYVGEKRRLLRVVLAFFGTAATSLFWGLRSFVLGAAPFGIRYLRLYPPSAEETEVANLLSIIFPTSLASDRIGLLTPVGFAFHPLTNAFFVLITTTLVIQTYRSGREGFAVYQMLFWYLGYITIMGYYPSGRHLLPVALCLSGLLALSLESFNLPMKERNRLMLLVVTAFAATSILQMMTVGMVLALFLPMDVIQTCTPIIPYTANFGLATTPDLVAKAAWGALIVTSLLAVLIWKTVYRTVLVMAIPKRQCVGWFLVMTLMFGATAPVIAHGWVVSSGNLMEYDSAGSWNRGDFALAAALAAIVPEDQFILTYGDVVLSYSGFRVVDLVHGGLYTIRAVLDAQNESQVVSALVSSGIRFLVLPTNSSYLASSYARFLSYLPFPEEAANSSEFTLLFVNGGWRVYHYLD